MKDATKRRCPVCDFIFDNSIKICPSCGADMKKFDTQTICIFLVIMLFIMICASIKGFWEITFVLAIVLFSTIFAFIKDVRN